MSTEIFGTRGILPVAPDSHRFVAIPAAHVSTAEQCVLALTALTASLSAAREEAILCGQVRASVDNGGSLPSVVGVIDLQVFQQTLIPVRIVPKVPSHLPLHYHVPDFLHL